MVLLSKENTSAVIVTFNPDHLFDEAMNRHIELFGFIIIVDNKSSISPISYMGGHDNIEYIQLRENMGIAYALNVGIRRALSIGYNWIFTFDQDSIPIKNFLFYYNEVFQKLPLAISQIGLISTKHVPHVPSTVSDNVKIKHTCSLITSGMLHNGEIMKRTGLYCERMFIDGVDFEFALRCAAHGFYTIRIQNPILEHKLGNPKVKSYIKGVLRITTTNHNANRRYYIMRNNIYITKKYFTKAPFWILKKNFFLTVDLFTMLLADDDRWIKMKQTLRGLYDGIRM